jgi:hypothetical protein
MFFTFTQNNSGGFFDEDEEKGIGHYVIVEANSAEEANTRAESIGIYFNGCDDGLDCDCCGDRWSPTWSSEGEKTPMIYGEPAKDAFVHYLNNPFEKV